MPRQISVLLQTWVAASSFGPSLSVQVFASCVAAMSMGSPRGVLYGCSESFRRFVMKVIPQVVEDEHRFMSLDNQMRKQDFIEVFSGRAHLSNQMREASWRKVGMLSGLQNVWSIYSQLDMSRACNYVLN